MAEIGELASIHYIAMLDDGRELENTRKAGEPLSVKIGAGSMLPAVERTLLDMLPGDRRVFELEPDHAYGLYDPELVQHIPANALPNAKSLPVGNFVGLNTRLGPIRAKVIKVNDEEIVLDCNHELAGHTITFDIEMLSVMHESAIQKELHPAGCACGCDKLKQQIG